MAGHLLGLVKRTAYNESAASFSDRHSRLVNMAEMVQFAYGPSKDRSALPKQ